jgi:hypothetical protein
MNLVYYVLGGTIGILLIGAIVVVLMASGTKSQKRRLDDLKSRHIARQPWDVHSADGRANR